MANVQVVFDIGCDMYIRRCFLDRYCKYDKQLFFAFYSRSDVSESSSQSSSIGVILSKMDQPQRSKFCPSTQFEMLIHAMDGGEMACDGGSTATVCLGVWIRVIVLAIAIDRR